MNASVRIILAEQTGVPLLPVETVSHDSEDRPVVTVLASSGKTVLRRVSLGLANNKSVQIIRGLQLGERVVLAPAEAQGD
jgi:multidrug efflux pump subunit AcrA (membrane-fusion protein)